MATRPGTVDELFKRHPYQWGLRGDSGAWSAMQQRLSGTPMPGDAFALQDLLEDAFNGVVGVDLRSSEEDAVYVAEFDEGGMSAGAVHLPTWRDRLLPILIDRSQLT